ncbi:MAG: pyrroline-5-carboxylate reductase [Lysobacteraceae bacterium]|nr:MAG: pyrroline-5-carboxylate reductase [Xanthomonadaceae bacterium]
MSTETKLTIVGAGNLGLAIARGLVESKALRSCEIKLTRRKLQGLENAAGEGFRVGNDNPAAVAGVDTVIVAVEPHQLDAVLDEIRPSLTPEQIVVSVVSGATLSAIRSHLGDQQAIVRAMPNTAIEIRQSMTCIAVDDKDAESAKSIVELFDHVGRTLVIDEEQMAAATALGACGVAFFLRAVRAASQGGIEIGFSSADALTLASQTALGAAGLLLARGQHPEREIDRVTTPRGCTIAGLNRMEHEGFSSAMIKGITTSAGKITGLY